MHLVGYPSELRAFFQFMIVAFSLNIFSRIINRLLTRHACSVLYWEIKAFRFFCTSLVIPYWSAYLIEHLKDFLCQIVTASYYKEYWYSGMNPAILKAQSNQWLSSLQENSKTRWPAPVLLNFKGNLLILQPYLIYKYHILNITGRFHIICFVPV